MISNGACLSVPCQYREEGETELIAGSFAEVPKERVLVFDGVIATPDRSLLFDDAELTELLTYPVMATTTRIRIWTDGSRLPDRVVVGIG